MKNLNTAHRSDDAGDQRDADAFASLHVKLDKVLAQVSVASPRFQGVSPAAKYSGLSPASIRRLISTGKLTGLRPVRGRVVVDLRELDALLLSSTAKPRKSRGSTNKGGV